MSGSLRVAVVGATGLVGREVVALLAERQFPVTVLSLFASSRSAGETVEFGEDAPVVRELSRPFPDVGLAFFCATPAVSREFAAEIAAKGAVVIDLAGAGLGDPTPERKILSLPSSLARFVAAPLQAVAPVGRLRRVIVTLLLSASAYGRAGVERLGRETVALLNGQEASEESEDGERPEALAFNCIPENPAAGDALSTRLHEEILRLVGGRLPLALRVVRVPTFYAHAASVSLETTEAVDPERVRQALRTAPSLLVGEATDPPVGTLAAAGADAIYVGGLQQDPGDPAWHHFWATADSLRQGAALAAVALAEKTIR